MKPFLPSVTARQAIVGFISLLLVGLLLPLALRGPRVVRIDPAPGTADALPARGIRVTFDQWVLPNTVLANARLDPPAPLVITWHGSSATLAPRGGLRYGTRYRLTLGDGVRNLLGRPLQRGATLSFSTVPYVAVARRGPDDGTANVALGAPVSVAFDTPVVPAAAVAAALADTTRAAWLPQPIRLFAGGAQVAGEGRWLAPTLFSFFPKGGLRAATTYTATIDANLLPGGRVRLQRGEQWHFTTAAPLLASTRPFDGASDVPPDAPVRVFLAPGTDARSAAAHFALRDSARDALVPGDTTVQGCGATGEPGSDTQRGFSILNAQLATGETGSAPQRGFSILNSQFSAPPCALRFKPHAPLRRGARYVASLSPGVRTLAGAPLNEKPLSWAFSVLDALRVAEARPASGAIEVDTAPQRLSLRFSAPVANALLACAQNTTAAGTQHDVCSPGSASSASLQSIMPGSAPLRISPPLPGVGTWLDASTYVYSPTAALQPATTYQIAIDPALRDAGGATLAGSHTWTFTTIRPQVVATEPAPDAIAMPGDPIQVVFNQPMEPRSLSAALSLTDVLSNRQVAYEIAITGTVAALQPLLPLERGKTYRVSVANSAHAPSGMRLALAHSADFQVAPLPRLVGSFPASADSSAYYVDRIQLSFNAPMDWASVARHLSITPRPSAVVTRTQEGPSSFTLSLHFAPAADTDYRVTLGADARDRFGVRLGTDASFSFHTRPTDPGLSLVQPSWLGATYSAYAPVRVPVRHGGFAQITTRLYRLSAERMASSHANISDHRYRSEAEALVREQPFAFAGNNQGQTDLLTLGRLDPGLYVLEVRGPQNYPNDGYYDQQFFSVSRYAITLKQGHNQLFAWVIDMQSGKPAVNLPLSAGWNSGWDGSGGVVMSLGSTDESGMIDISTSFSGDNSLFVWSPAGAGFVFGASSWNDGIDPWSFELPSAYDQPAFVGNVYTDRPLYRPDQPVYVRGALRADTRAGYALPPAATRVLVTISAPDNTRLLSTVAPLTSFGSFTATLALAAGAQLGDYTISVGPANAQSGEVWTSGSFKVAEYRKPAFEVVASAQRADVVQGDALNLSAAARYYFGGAIAQAPVRWRLLASPLPAERAAAPGYSFDDGDDAYGWYRRWYEPQEPQGGRLIADGSATTDAEGRFSLSLPAALGENERGQRLTLDVEIDDVDGQSLAAQATVAVHAAAYEVGLKTRGYVALVGRPQQVYLVAIDASGAPAAARPVELSIFRRDWYSVRERGNDGRLYWTSRVSDTLVQTRTVATDATGRADAAFTPKVGGSYRIAATARDDAGRSFSASAFSWAYGGGAFWGIDSTNRIGLVADRQSYSPGDTAQILVPAPWKNATALITIERGAVIDHQVVQLGDASALLPIAIKPGYAPNVYLSVVLVKPGKSPDVRVGIINLPVATNQQELTVTVAPDRAQARPGDEVTYTVKTADYTGAPVPAEVSLALVDKAILALADDPNPSLLRAFYQLRPLGVFTAQSLTALMDRVTATLQLGSKGGGGGIAADVLVRRNFPDTAYWNPTLVTGADGTARISLHLPDNTTTWRMTARAITADTRVGEATVDLVATQPLLVRAALPRFLTVGDTAVLRAVIHNATTDALSVTLRIEAGSLTLRDAPQQTAQVSPGGELVVGWHVDVPDTLARLGAPDNTLVRFTLTGASPGGAVLRDAVEHTLPVQRFAEPDITLESGQASPRVAVGGTLNRGQLRDGDYGLPADGTLKLELTPSLAAGIASSLSYLDHYPHGCTEQTASRFGPNAVVAGLLKLLGVKPGDPLWQPLQSSLDRNLQAGVQRLYELQHPDGGWGWWEDDASQSYLTAYALQALTQARAAGFAVDKQVYTRGVQALRAMLDHGASSGYNAPRYRDNRAYMLYVLAEAGAPQRGRSVALFETRAGLSTAERAYLLLALHALGDQPERVATVANEIAGAASVRGDEVSWEDADANPWAMDSATRTTALALLALNRADPQGALVPGAVRHLMRARTGGHWRTTHESAASLVALADYLARSGELNASYRYTLAQGAAALRTGQVNRSNLAQPVQVALGLRDLLAPQASPLTLEKAGAGQLYYALSYRSYGRASAVQPRDEGLAVQRAYVAVNPATLLPTGALIRAARLGDVVQVQLTLVVPEFANYLAVEDMLPAGLEPIDTSLKTASAAAQDPQLAGADGSPWWWYFTHAELHDNRVALFATYLSPGTYHYSYLARATTPGTFETLPASAYRMYAPEVNGRSAGATFTVEP